MSGLAEDTLEETSGRQWGRRLLLGAGTVLLLAALVWGLRSLTEDSRAPRTALPKISILPDAPLPPPPPPEEQEPEPEPVPQPEPLPQEQQPEPLPETAQLKMEGPAGDGPSAFASGAVTTDYIGGAIGPADRARYQRYTSGLEDWLRDELTRMSLRGISARIYVWLAADGRVEKIQVRSSRAASDAQLEAALASIAGVREAPPAGMPMPAGLQINVP